MESTESSPRTQVSFVRESHHPAAAIKEDICPTCGQAIPPEKLGEVQQRAQRQAAEQEEQLRAALEVQKAAVLAEKQAELDKVRKAADAAVERAKQEVANARDIGRKEAEAAVAAKLATAQREKEAAEAQLKTAKADAQRLAEEQLRTQRDALERASTEALQKEQAKAFEERQKLHSKLEELQRQIEKKSADELGEAAELDLREALHDAFPDDRFRAIDKGVAGADLWQDVVHNGEVCGRIVYDSKNRNAWRNDYVDKLKADQIEAEGDYAILATRVFPAGVRQLHIQNDVFVAHPARAVVLATMLREQIIQMHRHRLSSHERNTKTAALYEFIASDRCRQIFDQFEGMTQDMLNLEVDEQKQHAKNWKKRGELIKKAERVVLGQLRGEIDRIIEGNDATA